ncbi:hypothetical protein LJ656_33595 [Paraburkholderia sp. MMS20-SJTR3]|uniref:Protein L n=1 Tax=Paraburkholderia sejongensis TaxID=2886946 RepID=A0ABS8K5S7_9BURK|nr:hypothetical protein [Paraburkholderia sp. MMS20-SJTR3]MCC8397491.1 hypothetical protein [Paraburkholderia sp. MMS20-SJTR3]
MAFYQNGDFLTHEQRPEYNTTHHPGQIAALSGVYRCDGCHSSVVSTKERPLPPQIHHQHTAAQGGPLASGCPNYPRLNAVSPGKLRANRTERGCVYWIDAIGADGEERPKVKR